MQEINLQKISNYLFYLFIFLLPWQTVLIIREIFIEGDKFQYTTIGIYIFEIVLILWMLFLSTKIKKFFHNYKKNFLNNFILLFALWTFLSTVWSNDKYLTLFFSLQLLLGIVLFFLIQKSNFDIKKIAGLFLLSSFFQGLLGVFQSFTQSSFSNKWIGLSPHPVLQGGVSVLENADGRWLRAYGGMSHPNILGGFLAISLILGILFYLKAKSNKNFWERLVLIILPVNFLALLLTFSRSAWLGFILGIFFLIYYLSKKERSLLKKVHTTSILFVIIFIIFLTSYSDIIIPRFSNESRLEKKSTTERIALAKESKEAISENFLLGVGAGNYTNHLYENSPNKKPIWQYQPVHNTFLLVFAELGIIGIFLFLGVLFFAFQNIRKEFKNRKTEKIFFLSTLIILFVALLFDHWIWTTSSGLLLFWLLLGFYKKRQK